MESTWSNRIAACHVETRICQMCSEGLYVNHQKARMRVALRHEIRIGAKVNLLLSDFHPEKASTGVFKWPSDLRKSEDTDVEITTGLLGIHRYRDLNMVNAEDEPCFARPLIDCINNLVVETRAT